MPNGDCSMIYLEKDEIVKVNNQVTGHAVIINAGALDNAVEGPQRTFSGHEIYPTLPGKVYALALPIAQNHPFADGNKRTATISVNQFLQLNGHFVSQDDQAILIDNINNLADENPIEEDDFIEAVGDIIQPNGV